MDIRALPGRRREVLVAVVPPRRGKLGDRRRHQVDRIAREMRIGDVALHALHRQRPRQRPAAAVLDHVAKPVDRRRFADDAVIDRLTLRREALDDANRAVDRRAFLVGREQHGNGAGCIGMRGDKGFDGGDEGRHRALHVGRAAPVQPAVADGRRERVGVPFVERPGRHDVGVPGEADQRMRATAPRPQIGHAIGHQCFAAKAERLRGGRRRAPGSRHRRE